MPTMLDIFKAIMVIQLFYAFSITIIVEQLPEDEITYVNLASNVGENFDLDTVSEEVSDTLQAQKNIPLIEVGALVFYSGNILIDFMLNFLFAVPQMISLIINGIMVLFSIPPFFTGQVGLLVYVVITAMYAIGVIQILTAIRSGRVV